MGVPFPCTEYGSRSFGRSLTGTSRSTPCGLHATRKKREQGPQPINDRLAGAPRQLPRCRHRTRSSRGPSKSETTYGDQPPRAEESLALAAPPQNRTSTGLTSMRSTPPLTIEPQTRPCCSRVSWDWTLRCRAPIPALPTIPAPSFSEIERRSCPAADAELCVDSGAWLVLLLPGRRQFQK